MEQSVLNSTNIALTYGRGYVYSLRYHFVWCTKYRRPILEDEIRTDLMQMLHRLAAEYAFRICALDVMPDHVHMLLDCRPQFCPSTMAKILKGNTARWMFIKHPELKDRLPDGHLWDSSYCVVTVSDRSLKQVRQYLASRKQTPPETGHSTQQ